MSFPWDWQDSIRVPVTPDVASLALAELSKPEEKRSLSLVQIGGRDALGWWIPVSVLQHHSGQQFVNYRMVEINGEHA